MTDETIVTYRVEDAQGNMRAAGTTLEKATSIARSLTEDPGVAPLKIERVTYTSQRRVELVEIVKGDPGHG